jgi:hypothetical protein
MLCHLVPATTTCPVLDVAVAVIVAGAFRRFQEKKTLSSYSYLIDGVRHLLQTGGTLATSNRN